ncbi:MAG TPA: VOC family protein [Planctomycetota bacterium]|jgi:catechol 2,3-dioxygenase-like lactoylglutathione lyase family enzyme|nr:VOC family protein [Planctomycetota bacterium]
MKPSINIITVAVQDLKRSLAFYRDGLGWPAWWPTDDSVDSLDHAAFELQKGLSLVLYPRASLARDAQESDPRPTSAEFSLTQFVASKADVDAVIRRAQAAGAELMRPPSDAPWGYSGRFKDPDGHLWEILWNPDAGAHE